MCSPTIVYEGPSLIPAAVEKTLNNELDEFIRQLPTLDDKALIAAYEDEGEEGPKADAATDEI